MMNTKTAVIDFPDSIEKFPFKKLRRQMRFGCWSGPEGHADVVEGLSD